MGKEIRLSQLMAESFYAVHQDIAAGKHTHYWLKGGRGSTKSSFVSLEIILGLLADKRANGVVLRKVGNNLKDSVFEQLWWAIQALGLQQRWQRKVSPPELTDRITGQKILFRGGDHPKKIKSMKCQQGYVKYVWYEEVDEFFGMAEIRSMNQSLLRGGEKFVVFYTYNPPKSQRNWVNLESELCYEDKYIHHSTYLTVPKAWLGEQFFREAEHIKEVQPEIYRHEYLGEVTGTGGEVFHNITIREITEEEISQFDAVARGLDWGYAKDPLHYTVTQYDRKRKRLYIYFEIQQAGLSNRKAWELIQQENKQNGLIQADSAEPKSIAELQGYGARIVGVKKGPDSVVYGIKWLQALEEIIIDGKRCPKTAKEFLCYALEEDGNDGWKARFPDRNNHAIDAVRYAREPDMRQVQVR